MFFYSPTIFFNSLEEEKLKVVLFLGGGGAVVKNIKIPP